MGRTKNSILNFLVGIGSNLLTLILGFVSRNIFLYFLSIEYLGVSGLFSSVLTMLSLAELGFASAIIYSLYKPLADKDEETIVAIMQLFRKVYRTISLIVFVAGMCCLPILDFIVGDGGEKIEHLPIIYVLFVINTSVTYLFSYNETLITADQKAYKLAAIKYISNLLLTLLPLVTLALTREYIVFLVTQIVVRIFTNIVIYFRVIKEYPILLSKEKRKLPAEISRTIKKNVLALAIYKIAIAVTAGTDNILISIMFGVTAVGIYSNYTLITQSIISLVSQGMNAIVSSIGNLAATSRDDDKISVFYSVQLMNFWLYGFASIGMFFCINSVIKIWLPDVEVFSMSVVLPLVLSFFLLGMQNSVSLFRDAQGLFWQGKLRPIAQTVINLVASVLIARLSNSVSGIVWGTVLSRLLVNFWFDPYIVFKYGFKKPVFPYFKKYSFYVLVEMVAFFSAYCVLCLNPFDDSWLSLIFDICSCTVIVNIVFLAFFCRLSEFQYIYQHLLMILVRHK